MRQPARVNNQPSRAPILDRLFRSPRSQNQENIAHQLRSLAPIPVRQYIQRPVPLNAIRFNPTLLQLQNSSFACNQLAHPQPPRSQNYAQIRYQRAPGPKIDLQRILRNNIRDLPNHTYLHVMPLNSLPPCIFNCAKWQIKRLGHWPERCEAFDNERSRRSRLGKLHLCLCLYPIHEGPCKVECAHCRKSRNRFEARFDHHRCLCPFKYGDHNEKTNFWLRNPRRSLVNNEQTAPIMPPQSNILSQPETPAHQASFQLPQNDEDNRGNQSPSIASLLADSYDPTVCDLHFDDHVEEDLEFFSEEDHLARIRKHLLQLNSKPDKALKDLAYEKALNSALQRKASEKEFHDLFDHFESLNTHGIDLELFRESAKGILKLKLMDKSINPVGSELLKMVSPYLQELNPWDLCHAAYIHSSDAFTYRLELEFLGFITHSNGYLMYPIGERGRYQEFISPYHGELLPPNYQPIEEQELELDYNP